MEARMNGLTRSTPGLGEVLEPRLMMAFVGIVDNTLRVVANRHVANTIVLTSDALSNNKLHVTLNGHTATFDKSVNSIDHILVFGGEGNDLIADRAGPGARKFTFSTTLEGGGGNDTIIGGSANDLLVAGRNGNCFLSAGGGDDTLVAGDGNDTLSGDSGGNLIIGGRGTDQLLGGSGNDLIFAGDNNNRIVGGGGYNELVGGAGVNIISGGDNRDTIYGGGNPDTVIHRGIGEEIINGGTLFGKDKVLRELMPRIPAYPI